MIEFLLKSKKYSNNFELKNISISVTKGECTSLIGHNGSGKTTLLNSLLGFVKCEGSLEMDGKKLDIHENVLDFDYLRSKIAYVPDESLLFDFLTVEEYFDLVQKNYFNQIDPSYIQLLIKIFQIQEYKQVLIKSLSFGTKKKIQIIAQLAKKTEYIVFDEPTNGLDPDMIIILKKVIKKLREENIGVLLSTHQLKFCEDLSNHIVIIQNGQELLQKSMIEITSTYQTTDLEKIYTELNTPLYDEVGDYIETIRY